MNTDPFAVNPEDRISSVSRTHNPKVRMELRTDPAVKSPSTSPTVENGSSKYHGVLLPSQFHFYEWKELQVRQFNIQDLLSIYEARVKGKFRLLVDVISSTLLNQSAYDLTFEDFWYLLYWHRLNSYRKSKLQLEWTCSDPQHLDWIENGRDGQPVEASTLENMDIVSKSNLEVVDADTDTIDRERRGIQTEYGLATTPIMISQYVDFLEEQEERERAFNKQQTLTEQREQAIDNGEQVEPEAAFQARLNHIYLMPESDVMLSRYAMIVACGNTLKQRRDFLRTLEDPELFMDLESFLATLDYGVTEKFQVTCKECGASREVTNSIDALTFLPHIQRAGHL